MTAKLLDVVALTVELPEYNLYRGQVGTIVETLANGTAFEVEFSDRAGRTYESVGLRPEKIMVLHFEPMSPNSKSEKKIFMKTIPVALTIAGSDSGGGAGIQADLRTFAFHRVHGTSAISCVTAQNTVGVTRVDALPPEAVIAQIQVVVEDIGVQAAKTGMLLNQEIIAAVAQCVKNLHINNLVVDPVMVSRTGVQLLDDDAVKALRNILIPLAVIVTPNRYEAQILSGLQIHSLDEMRAAAEIIHRNLKAKAVLIKGGGMEGSLRGVDVWFDGQKLETLTTKQVKTKNTHGTGCTLSAAIAANLAYGENLFTAVQKAKEYVTNALGFAINIGKGQGPVGHFYPLLISDEKSLC